MLMAGGAGLIGGVLLADAIDNLEGGDGIF
jgi:hypothetical protein